MAGLLPGAMVQEQYKGQEFNMLKELWRKLGSEFSYSGCSDVEGRTFQNNGDESIRDLIHFASRIQDQDVQRELLLFYLNCSPVVQEYLRSEEVLVKSHFLSQASGRK